MSPFTLKEPVEALEEQLEFSNITDLRQDFLRKVEEIQKNSAIRLLILKHGRPQAVLMSAEAYDALKKVVNFFLNYSEGMSREQSIDAAINRFESERSSVLERSSVSAAAEVSAIADSKLAAG